jgi:predicted transcriptional regulator
MYMIKLSQKSKEIMGRSFPLYKWGSIEEVSKLFNRDNAAVLIDLGEEDTILLQNTIL